MVRIEVDILKTAKTLLVEKYKPLPSLTTISDCCVRYLRSLLCILIASELVLCTTSKAVKQRSSNAGIKNKSAMKSIS